MTITLSRYTAYEPIRKAYDEKRLSAQNAVSHGCYYRHPETGCPCAVGVLIPDGAAILNADFNDAYRKEGKEAPNSSSIETLIDKGFVATDDDGWFSGLQVRHDDWQGAAHTKSPCLARTEAEFLAYLETARIDFAALYVEAQA